MSKVTVQELSTIQAEECAPTPLPIPQLTEPFPPFDRLGRIMGRFAYLLWGSDNPFLGLRSGDVIKVDRGVRPKMIRGEIVWVEVFGSELDTMGALDVYSYPMFDVWLNSHKCERGYTADCMPRKVLGKLRLESSQRAFLMGKTPWKNAESIQQLNEVLKPRPTPMKQEQPAVLSFIPWLLAQPTRGRLLDLTPKLKQKGLCSDTRRKGKA